MLSAWFMKQRQNKEKSRKSHTKKWREKYPKRSILTGVAVLIEGFEYHMWTVDDPETARRFKRLGAESITINVPGYISQNLAD